MMKRFTETCIWDQDWFIDMPQQYKLFWFYLKDKCNHAGIWNPNTRLFEAMIEGKIDLKKAIDFFNKDKERILILKSGHWFVIDFFFFQYGNVLNKGNRVHKSIYDIYIQEDIDLASIRGLKEVKEGVKDKDKDKDISKEDSAPEIEKIPYKEIVDLFNSTCKSLSKIQTLSDSRKSKIKVRWSELSSLEKFTELFKKVQSSKFLIGDNPKGWKASFDWLMENDKNWLKVMEGNYNKESSKPYTKTVSPKDVNAAWK